MISPMKFLDLCDVVGMDPTSQDAANHIAALQACDRLGQLIDADEGWVAWFRCQRSHVPIAVNGGLAAFLEAASADLSTGPVLLIVSMHSHSRAWGIRTLRALFTRLGCEVMMGERLKDGGILHTLDLKRRDHARVAA